MATAQASSESEAFLKQLNSSMQTRMKDKKLSIDTETENELMQFISAGVSNMTEAQLRSKAHQKQAHNNVLELVDRIADTVKIKNLDHSSDELESVLSISLRGFCPRFPFC